MAGKWKVLIVWHLSFGSRRFAEIRDFLSGASEKVLTAQLRELQHHGVIERMVTPLVPPRVDYRLTDRGKELVTAMEAMCARSMKHLGITRKWPRPAIVQE
jgi:DNA-binding HxlR family transcriptional regulator